MQKTFQKRVMIIFSHFSYFNKISTTHDVIIFYNYVATKKPKRLNDYYSQKHAATCFFDQKHFAK